MQHVLRSPDLPHKLLQPLTDVAPLLQPGNDVLEHLQARVDRCQLVPARGEVVLRVLHPHVECVEARLRQLDVSGEHHLVGVARAAAGVAAVEDHRLRVAGINDDDWTVATGYVTHNIVALASGAISSAVSLCNEVQKPADGTIRKRPDVIAHLVLAHAVIRYKHRDLVSPAIPSTWHLGGCTMASKEDDYGIVASDIAVFLDGTQGLQNCMTASLSIDEHSDLTYRHFKIEQQVPPALSVLDRPVQLIEVFAGGIVVNPN